MKNIKTLEKELYLSLYGLPKVGNAKEIWLEIKHDPQILIQASELQMDKWNRDYILVGQTICESMLYDYDNLDAKAYEKLINLVFSNTYVARLTIGEAERSGFSFLLLSLCNLNLKLTEEQKVFAEREAMYKFNIPFSKKNSVEERDKFKIENAAAQVHGHGYFDIRYHILRNPNWCFEEKKKLVDMFWPDQSEFITFLEQWELDIVNANENYLLSNFSSLDISKLFDYSYEYLVELYQNKIIADKIYAEITFCEEMDELLTEKNNLILNKIKN